MSKLVTLRKWVLIVVGCIIETILAELAERDKKREKREKKREEKERKREQEIAVAKEVENKWYAAHQAQLTFLFESGNILPLCQASSDESDQEGDENNKSDKESEGDQNGKSDKESEGDENGKSDKESEGDEE
ncbi:hypothetical protein H5410_064749 [Solanum commersonii]|uniref:Uncharacterized protein n=1 Tax=Solanum commersonii TaxID=4109 RepID=A0A9J5VYG9_SOLCO|nr:hypothetical protein H5410_064749 [Solanum commersonii]